MFMVTIIASRLHGPENTTYKGIKQEMRWRRGCTGVLVMLSISCVTCHVIQMFRASDLASKKKMECLTYLAKVIVKHKQDHVRENVHAVMMTVVLRNMLFVKGPEHADFQWHLM